MEFHPSEMENSCDFTVKGGFGLYGSCNGLAIDHLWFADIYLDRVFSQQSIDKNLQVKFAHSRDYGLPGIGILTEVERGVLYRQLLERLKSLLLVGAGAWLHGDGDYRFINFNMFQQKRMFWITNGVPSCG